MSQEKDKITLTGVVVESLPDTHFRVQLEDGTLMMAHLTGKMRYNRIRIVVGDIVEIELDRYGGKPKLVRRK